MRKLKNKILSGTVRSTMMVAVIGVCAGQAQAFAEESVNYFQYVQSARNAAREAQKLGEPYQARKAELNAQADRLANNPPDGCAMSSPGQVRDAKCDAHEEAKKTVFQKKGQINVVLDRANKLLQDAENAAEEAESKLAHARISADNADSRSVGEVTEAQRRFLANEKILQDFDERQSSKGALMGFLSKLKDKVMDKERSALVRALQQSRTDYLDSLARNPDVKLDATLKDLAVEVPAVSENAILLQNPEDCADLVPHNNPVDAITAGIKNTFANIVDDIRVRERRTGITRCGAQIATKKAPTAEVRDVSVPKGSVPVPVSGAASGAAGVEVINRDVGASSAR